MVSADVIHTGVRETTFTVNVDRLISISSTTGAPTSPVPSPLPPISEDIRGLDFSSSTDVVESESHTPHDISTISEASLAAQYQREVENVAPQRSSSPLPATNSDLQHERQSNSDRGTSNTVTASGDNSSPWAKHQLSPASPTDPAASLKLEESGTSLMDDLLMSSSALSDSPSWTENKKTSVCSTGSISSQHSSTLHPGHSDHPTGLKTGDCNGDT